jgi:hypothetical protein
MTITDFEDIDVADMDTVPPLSDVEYPCRACGKEAGPYGGRGPKPKLCKEHKTTTAKRNSVPKVSGNVATHAAQATAVLVQLNGMLAMGVMAMQMFETAHAIAGANEQFEVQAYNALITDPALCQLILKGGVKSAKISLGLAYAGMAMSVGPTAVNEFKSKKAERLAAKEAAENEAGA